MSHMAGGGQGWILGMLGSSLLGVPKRVPQAAEHGNPGCWDEVSAGVHWGREGRTLPKMVKAAKVALTLF